MVSQRLLFFGLDVDIVNMILLILVFLVFIVICFIYENSMDVYLVENMFMYMNMFSYYCYI